MSDLIANDEQARILTEGAGVIFIRDSQGRIVGRAVSCSEKAVIHSKLTAEEIAEAEKRLDTEGPWRTTEQVLARLRSAENR